MPRDDFSTEFLARLEAIADKRPRTVIEHILRHGFITTGELRELYGYDHPPRAARDVREHGIVLETFYLRSSTGRRMGAYRLVETSVSQPGKAAGRRSFSRQFKAELVEVYGERCNVCSERYEARYLQIDHRVPYEVSGEPPTDQRVTRDYMLVCASCNRAKSWSCEHCANRLVEKRPELCSTCYWGNPEDYRHVALRPIRRLDIVWTEDEVEVFDRIRQYSGATNQTMPEYVKVILKRYIEDLSD